VSKSNLDLREVAVYSLAEAATYLKMPVATLRSWALGRTYPTESGEGFFKPLFEIADNARRKLSFYNLVEAYVLDVMRRQEHRISMLHIRKAIDYLKKHLSLTRPLVEQQFVTNGVDLLVEIYGNLVNISQDGQLALKEVLKQYLRDIKRDTSGLPTKLYLFKRPEQHVAVVIDPRISFGYPVLDGTGISTAVLAQRYLAGDSIDDLADDYGSPKNAIEEAIRREVIPLRKAA